MAEKFKASDLEFDSFDDDDDDWNFEPLTEEELKEMMMSLGKS